MTSPRYLTKSRFKLAAECPTKLFYTGKDKVYKNTMQEDSFLALRGGAYAHQDGGAVGMCHVFREAGGKSSAMRRRSVFWILLLVLRGTDSRSGGKAVPGG